ncbi:hypothetical protein BDW42DRAFT_164837 [Aspergillus taichungensis]|uniref:Uncharacterized protein n=1 Tax=Aspergillus taichungensis TaxID=482145 RepID=A0A2J5I0X7_9EURO|nr:hypothetical protein BDW42DRAFT_164837 [Aspergillus taichungensis]
MDSPSSARSSPTKSPSKSPSKALNPLSPERMNQQPGSGSPIYPELRNTQRKSRGMSDVQAKVAYLNGLSRTGSPAGAAQTSAANTAALQRAILGREEAESSLAHVSSQLTEAQSRERRISERLESLLEELHTTKERQAHERSIFEKEIRKARKEAFRAGSTLVKTQEELKHAKTESRVLRDELHHERSAKEQARQEAFERAYTLAGLTEELETLKERLRSAETNNHSESLQAQAHEMHQNNAGRMSLAEGDLAMFATPTQRRPKRPADGPAASPLTNQSHDTVDATPTPPKRPRLSDITAVKEDQDIFLYDARSEMVNQLESALQMEQRLRSDAEDMIEFLKLECHFKRCTCRLLEHAEKEARIAQSIENSNTPHISETIEDSKETPRPSKNSSSRLPEEGQSQLFDRGSSPNRTPKNLSNTNAARVPKPNPQQLIELTQEFNEHRMLAEAKNTSRSSTPDEIVEEPEPAQIDEQSDDDDEPEEPLITFSPETGTFHTIPSPVRLAAAAQEQRLPGSPLAKVQNARQDSPPEIFQTEASPPGSPTPAVIDVPFDPVPPHLNSSQHGESQHNIRKIPLRLEEPPAQMPIDRENALAQIKARRSRTNLNNSNFNSSNSNNMPRSVSASESTFRSGGMGITPIRGARRIPGVQNSDPREDIRRRRDMSAPIRMHHK